ncbi:C-type lectin 10, partial [Operophtera brumata]
MTKKDSSVSTILTGVQGTSSEEGKSDNSCVAWEHRSTTVRAVNCDDTLSFVCFKKKYSVKVAGCGTADSEYTYDSRSGSCYKFHQGGVNWDNAFEDCQHEGAHLTVINNQLESIVLQELYDKKKPKKSDDDHQTLKEAGYETWHRGEPNSSVPPEDCGGVLASPATSQLRDAIKDYVSQVNPSVSTIFAGVHADSSHGKFISMEEYAYNATSGSCYKFHRQGQTWYNANKKCKAEGAYLAIVNSQLESGVLKDLYAKNPGSVITSVYRNDVESYDDQAFIGIRDWASWTT